MTIARDIIQSRMPDFDYYIGQGESLDDIDEYGFTALIESIISRQIDITSALLARKVNVNKQDVAGRTPLHWAVDNNDLEVTKLLLEHGANPNAYTKTGLSVLVYPILREHHLIKQVLFQYGAKLDFALDFINAKLIGHRFELSGDVDIVTPKGEFIELDYEGFILEFTIDAMVDSLRRFTSSFATKHLKQHFLSIYQIVEGFELSAQLLKMQHHPQLTKQDEATLQELTRAPFIILPAASRGHAMCFVKMGAWWVKVDRGENALREGAVNFYRMNHPESFTAEFLNQFMIKKQPRDFYHFRINKILGLTHAYSLPLSTQIVGNCSWANVQGVILAALALKEFSETGDISNHPVEIYEAWLNFDKDRAIDDCIQRFYNANDARKASIAAMLGAILFQSLDDAYLIDIQRAEKMMPILTHKKYDYILKSYLDAYCINRLSRRGNNLLKILDQCGVNPNIGVNPISTGLKSRD